MLVFFIIIILYSAMSNDAVGWCYRKNKYYTGMDN